LQSAKNVGLSTVQWNTCNKDSKNETYITQDVKDAITLGVRGTPTYFVNDTRVEGVKTQTEWDNIILKALNK
jgi:protein-disulfide isomerase